MAFPRHIAQTYRPVLLSDREPRGPLIKTRVSTQSSSSPRISWMESMCPSMGGCPVTLLLTVIPIFGHEGSESLQHTGALSQHRQHRDLRVLLPVHLGSDVIFRPGLLT